MTIRETLAEMLIMQREQLTELRAILAVLEGPDPNAARPDPEMIVREAQSATDLIRAGVLKRHR